MVGWQQCQTRSDSGSDEAAWLMKPHGSSESPLRTLRRSIPKLARQPRRSHDVAREAARTTCIAPGALLLSPRHQTHR